jgi:hypothetical protein
VVNEGYVPLTDLDAHCFPTFVMGRSVVAHNHFHSDHFADYLGHADTVTIPCFRIAQKLLIGSEYENGSILDIEITYAFWHLNFRYLRRSAIFHFVSTSGTDGSQHWIFEH